MSEPTLTQRKRPSLVGWLVVAALLPIVCHLSEFPRLDDKWYGEYLGLFFCLGLSLACALHTKSVGGTLVFNMLLYFMADALTGRLLSWPDESVVMAVAISYSIDRVIVDVEVDKGI